MTTTTQAVPVLEVSAPEDSMDVLSDTGFDLGDSDIDLDLDTAPSVQDDEMSLNDVATDGGLDLHDLPADQDDFMADHGDLIEEDDMYVGDDATTAVSQNVDDGAVTFEADMLAPPDEDLIDYSDDEAQQPVKMQSPSVPEEDAQESYEAEAISAPANGHDEETQASPQPLDIDTSHDGTQTPQNDTVQAVDHDVSEPEHQAQGVVESQTVAEDDEHVHADDDGGVMLPTDEHVHNDVEAHHEDAQQETVDTDESEDDVNEKIALRPVTVNYAGNELWLFKQHDLDESGDFLLEDLSVAQSSISGLFQACRNSLGDDVSGEHEIGFRFDHLHNLELYEDNTACVAVSLERLVDLYHTLQAQDGNEDPECFYVTLQFRPRFATLLADVAQYAEQGSGYSALDAAVAAGETHFSNIFSSASTEHENVEWDDEENEEVANDEDENDDEGPSSPGSAHSIAPQNEEDGEPAEQRFEDVEDRGNDSSQDRTDQQQGVDLDEDPHRALDSQKEEPKEETFPQSANVDKSDSVVSHEDTEKTNVVTDPEAAVARPASESRDDRTPDQIAHDKQEADDFVDYSDDEDEQDVTSVPVHEPSPSSSTVQGDEPKGIQEPDTALEDERDAQDQVETGFDEHGDDATLLTQTQYGDDASHYAFQDYTETYDQGTYDQGAYDQGDPFQDFQADGTVGNPFEGNNAFNGDTNQDFADYDFQNLEGEVNLDFDEPSVDEANIGDQDERTFAIDENVTDADAFLDLDNAPEWAIDADPALNLPGEDAILLHDDDTTRGDDEGGVADHSAATTSTAANLALTSSNEHKPSSPQGQKRSIDEVSYGIDDAPNTTDAKRPRV